MFSALIEKLQRRQDLTVAEAAAAMDEVMEGRAQPAQIAGLLIALAMKGERPAEVVGLAQTMRARATQLSRPPAVVERCLGEVGLAFFFAPTFHPSMRHAAPTRRELGVRTAFNLLGPLTNPAGASRQLVGVPRPELTELVARSLALLGADRAWVVHGADGLDEISTTGYTKVSECRAGAVNTFYVHPADFGLPKAAPAALRGGDAADNVGIATAVLAGEHGAARDIVILNAASSLLIAGAESTIAAAIPRAAHALDSGSARAVLDRLIAVSNVAPAEAAS
ncbi:MAG: anthranilate phosphoribosyltransferase [Acidobacteria bacterium]|nr:anthranilate phosphoribosyltransferase [Acidobacteriota bacterium]